MTEEGLAGRGQRDLALRPIEQLDTEFLFQLADRRRKCRLRNVYPLGGPGEVQLGGHGDVVLQMA